MDQIGKALDKAKQDNSSNLRQWVTPGQGELGIGINAKNGIGFPPLRVETPNFEVMAKNHMLTEGNTESPILADHYRMLRTRLFHRMQPINATRVGLTSAMAKAGKSFTAINLATTIARASSDEVVLIDCDVRNPSIARGLGINCELGLIDVLSGVAEFKDVAFALSNLPNLKIIPGTLASDPQNRFEILTNRIHVLFDEIKALNPRATVVVDLPPVLVGDEVLGIAPHLDGFLLIVRDGDTDIETLHHAMDLLQDFPMFGSVLNDSKESLSHYAGYSYGAQAAKAE